MKKTQKREGNKSDLNLNMSESDKRKEKNKFIKYVN
jgi:hypothetical protein